jgi:hypothetical protein
MGMVSIELNDSGFAGSRSNRDNVLVSFGPVERSVVWKLVSDAKLPVLHFVILIDVVNLTQSKPIDSNINDQEPGVLLRRMRGPSDCRFHNLGLGKRSVGTFPWLDAEMKRLMKRRREGAVVLSTATLHSSCAVIKSL